jgi:hypothetical protein
MKDVILNVNQSDQVFWRGDESDSQLPFNISMKHIKNELKLPAYL